MAKSLFASSLREFALLLGALVVLYVVAQPLAQADLALGRGGRYFGVEPLGPLGLTPPLLASRAASMLAVLALSGWLVLLLGRRGGAPTALATSVAGVWAGASAVLVAPGQSTWPWWTAGVLALVVAPLLAHRAGRRLQHAQQPARAWLYPLWVLLTGLGLLWLLDYSARAAHQHLMLALQHFHALWIGYVLLTAGASLKPTLVGLLARILARLDGVALPVGLLLLFAFWIAAVLISIGLAPRQAAFRSELVRVAAYVIFGWIFYRWIDVQGGPRRGVLRGLVVAVVMVALAVLPMLGTGDNGQVLLAALAGAVLMAAALGALFRRPGVAAVLGAAVGAGLLTGLMALLHQFGPDLSSALAERLQALQQRYASHLEYLSELRWFWANTPPNGFGLGQVPWCGTLGSLTDGACNAIPRQAQSDYVLVVLAVLWGAPAAWAITLLTAAWLLGLLHGAMADASRLASQPQANRLAQWIVTVFSAVMLVQLFVTCFGALGQMPLTGVTYPLVGYGRAGLLVTAVCAALALNRPANT